MMRIRYTSPWLFWLTSALIVILIGFGIANLTGIGYADLPEDRNWRTFVGIFSLINAQFMLAGLLLVSFRMRFGTALLTLSAMFAFATFAPIPAVFQIHSLAVIILAIRHARRMTRSGQVSAVEPG